MAADVRDRFQEDLLAWAEHNLRDFPWRSTDSNLYEVFIAELLLTQTPADAVANVYPRFLSQYPSLEHITRAEVDELADVIEPLGLYNRRAKALKQIADQVEDELPDDPTELKNLPRVGPYVANATACIALDHQIPVVDTNVDRIYDRLFGSEWPNSPDEQIEIATQFLPENQARDYNLALLDFGAAVCKPTNPACEECFAKNYCNYFKHSTVD